MNSFKDINLTPVATGSRKRASLLESPIDATCEIAEKPHDTWYYSSNHVLVNRERMTRGIAPLMRNTKLDEFARHVAQGAATRGPRSNVKDLADEASDLKVDGNILKGSSIRNIHSRIMQLKCKARERILHDKFQQFGVGTCKREDGTLILVQVFSKKGRIDI